MVMTKSKNALAFAKAFFVSSIFPLHCVGCDVEGVGLCARCLEWGSAPELVERPGVDGVLALGPHANVVLQRAVHALKFGYVESIGQVLGCALGQEFARRFPGVSPVLVPVPLSAKRRLVRDFNQARKIAEGVASVLPGARIADVLVREKETVAQATLGRKERLANVDGAFAAVDYSSSQVWLVDDVVTTGATFLAAAQALRQVGVERISGMVAVHEA